MEIGYSAIPSLNTSNPNAPGAGAALFLTLPQVLGVQGAKTYVENLRASISQRARDIVTAGTAVRQEGLERLLELQAEQFGNQEGEAIWGIAREALSDINEAPVVEVVYGTALSTTLGGVVWILLPQT